MALPKIDSPTFTLTLPSSKGKKKVKYRPFTVKEEKILLIAAQSEESHDIANAIKQVINNCLISELEVELLPTYDIEYIFKHLRARSVNNIIELKIHDDDDGIDYDVNVDLDQIEVTFNPEHEYMIDITSNITVMLKDPSYNTIQKVSSYENEEELMMEMIIQSIDCIMVGEEDVLYMKEHTREEQEEFINSFPTKSMRDIEKFFQTTPKLIHNIKYTRKDGTVAERKIEGINNFFT